MMSIAMLTLKKFVLICVYIIAISQCSINAAVIKRENYYLNKNYNSMWPIFQKITGKTLREFPLLGYKIKKCFTHYYKNLKEAKKHMEDFVEIGRFPKEDIRQITNSPREKLLSVIKTGNKYGSNISSQSLKVPTENQIDIKSEEMEMNGQISNLSAENLFDAIIVGEPVESMEDQELYDGIIVGESDEEDTEMTMRPIRDYFERVKPDRRMTQFDSDSQPEENTSTVKVFADENKRKKMMNNVIKKLIREIDLDNFLKILINYKRTHDHEITFNKLNEILSKGNGSGTTKLSCISKELRRKLRQLGNTHLPYIYFDIHDDMGSVNIEEINKV